MKTVTETKNTGVPFETWRKRESRKLRIRALLANTDEARARIERERRHLAAVDALMNNGKAGAGYEER